MMDLATTDYISNLPDECLACIFDSLTSSDRNRCSLVCRRWLTVEQHSRRRLSLNAVADLQPRIVSLFSRFDAVTSLSLKCDLKSTSINDDALALISQQCRSLTRLKLRACRNITDEGMLTLAKSCKELKKLSCESCGFGAKAINAVVNNCSKLEELTVKKLPGFGPDGSTVEPIGPGVAASSVKSICLKDLHNGQCFSPLMTGAKNLKTLKLHSCKGNWDKVLHDTLEPKVASNMIEIHLEKVKVSNIAFAAICKCLKLETLRLVKIKECTDLGLVWVSEHCKHLRKLHIEGAEKVRHKGLISVAMCCPELEELVIVGLNPTKASLGALTTSCRNLKRLTLCGSVTIGDPEILCIAKNCGALKKLCIRSCPVSDVGLKGLAGGCPNLVKLKVKKCARVTPEAADSLRAKRPTLAVILDAGDRWPLFNAAAVELRLAIEAAAQDISSRST